MRQIIRTPAQIGEILRGRRKARRLSQAAIARQLGVGQSRVSILEADPASVPTGRLLLLLELLGLELVVQDKSEASRSKGKW